MLIMLTEHRAHVYTHEHIPHTQMNTNSLTQTFIHTCMTAIIEAESVTFTWRMQVK